MPTEKEQLDLFIPVVKDVSVHDQQDLMMYPFFSLSKRRTKPLVYESKNAYIEIIPNNRFGMATIWDYDILIYCASVVVNARNRGQDTSRRIQCKPYDLLKFIHRGTGGKDYVELKKGLARLKSTTIVTSIRDKSKRREEGFSWIDGYKIVEDEKSGKVEGIEIILSEWFYEGIANNKLILSITSDYFDLKKGYQRWLYRLVRKHGGKQENGWRFNLRQLHEKSGSSQRYSDFCRDIREIVKIGVPDYYLFLEKINGDTYLTFFSDNNMQLAVRKLNGPPGQLIATNITQ